MATFPLTTFPAPEDAYCPECSSSITLYDPMGSEFCVCSSCNIYIQFINEEPKKYKILNPPILKPAIPLGTEGLLDGVSFKVIAYLEMHEDGAAEYAWREYILYNYEQGYATLSEYDGHWNLLYGDNFLPDLEKPMDLTNSVMYRNVEYRLFHKYGRKITGLLGEFDWDVLVDRIRVQEFIAPPYVLVKEKTTSPRKQTNYYLGEYQEPKVIADAFKLDVNLFPAKSGILSNQPSKANEFWLWSFRASFIMMLVLVLVQLAMVYVKPEQTLMDQVFDIAYDPSKGNFEFKPFVTPSFKVTDASSAMDIVLTSGLSNNWLEATTVLVNEKTNQTWEVNAGIEYYSGVEGGESWSEGSMTTEVLLSEIPAGMYHLNVYPASGDPLRDKMSISVTINHVLWRNLLCYALLLIIVPFFCYLARAAFEKKRWRNSNYSPY
ncbi:DUF4178 domain-containing protein [Pedobacter sp. MC2016-14]|uniref:DUF4178 domain-containing protein n=1 Tax=Pedobacter sp. MC2016-14 TaxID=2897327 RepID=UPI001E4BF254|nr:DUF4178 domain-containing protein [Pedobacter sp. MC2016-14]MCD0490505.1 DUF4178 domain-containing protein [Pedobacter sp. MC2016-14]